MGNGEKFLFLQLIPILYEVALYSPTGSKPGRQVLLNKETLREQVGQAAQRTGKGYTNIGASPSVGSPRRWAN
jgi:hypothetical protein